MNLGIVVLIGMLILVVTGLHITQWAEGARYRELYYPFMGKLMAISPLLWIAGLVLWGALARYWCKGRFSRFKVASAARSVEKPAAADPAIGPAAGKADTRYLRRNRLWQEADQQTGIGLGGSLLGGLLLAIIVGVSLGPIAGLLAGAVAAAIGFSMLSGGSIVAAGAEGEDLAVQVVRHLPAGYTLFNQIRIPRAERNPIEADLIVVGPGVVHVIEVKHNKGEIQVRPESPEWTVFKTGRKGGSYETTMRNPIKQVRGQVDALARYLKSQGIKQWVTGSVALSHREASFQPVTHQDVAVLRLGNLVAHVQSVRRQQGASDTDAVVRAIARLVEQEDGGGPPPPAMKASELPNFIPSTSEASGQAGSELTVSPRRPPSLRSAIAETRYWPVGYALVLLATPWAVPGLWAWGSGGSGELAPMASAVCTSLLVALHASLMVWLNRCTTWLWVAGLVAAVHVGIAHALEGGLRLDRSVVLMIVSLLYLLGCAGLQFFRYEYVFGIPVVPHHRYEYEQTRPAKYEGSFERAHWLEGPDDFPFMQWEWIERKVRDAEYEVIGERRGRKGDGYSAQPAWRWPALTSVLSWSLIGAMGGGAILLLVMLTVRLQLAVCMEMHRYCDVRLEWVAWQPGLALMGIGGLLVALSLLLRGEQRA
jgi:hypothetical protein